MLRFPTIYSLSNLKIFLPAGDTKLSAFWNMYFSKPPHFGNRGAAPDLLTSGEN